MMAGRGERACSVAPDAGIGAPVMLDGAALDRLMPLYLVLAPDGRIRGIGPTARRLFADAPWAGRPVFSLLTIRRGGERITDAAALAATAGARLQIAVRGGGGAAGRLRLRGVAVPLAGGRGLLLNLGFGVDIVAAVRLLGLGAADFAATDMALELLGLSEANAAIMAEIRSHNVHLEEARLAAEGEALTDPLTGLGNRRAGDALLRRLCRERAPFALMHVDLDHFKRVNDTHGHAAGDRLLRHVARAMRQSTTGRDHVFRMGGDEFMIVLPGTAGLRRLQTVARGIIAAIRCAPDGGDVPGGVSASIGIVSVRKGRDGHGGTSGGTARGDDGALSPATISEMADHALYRAKGAGRATFAFAAPVVSGETGVGRDH